jgi:hypothetical protein
MEEKDKNSNFSMEITNIRFKNNNDMRFNMKIEKIAEGKYNITVKKQDAPLSDEGIPFNIDDGSCINLPGQSKSKTCGVEPFITFIFPEIKFDSEESKLGGGRTYKRTRAKRLTMKKKRKGSRERC